MSFKTIRSAGIMATVVLAAMGVSACSGSGGEAGAGAPVACVGGGSPTESRAPTVAVLAEVGRPGPALAASWGDALSTVVDGATATGSHLLLNGVGAGIGAPNLAAQTTLVGDGPNSLFRASNLKCKVKAVHAAYARLTTGPEPAALDVFSALRNLHDDLTGVTGGEVSVVLLSSLLNTVTVDLGDQATLQNPAAAINTLATAGLSFRCTGWRVYAIGGSFKNGQPTTAAVDSALMEFWREYFQRCGGALVDYDTELAEFPVTGEIGPPADLTMRVRRPPHAIVATISSASLFAVGSAVLQPRAVAGLQRLLPLLARAPGHVEVAGYTDDTGSPAVNGPLSGARAEALEVWIEQTAGVQASRITSQGYGSQHPVASNGTAAGRALNRRVVVTIQTA
jgi:outer membrane protein OmpA-like peptidoglycan-associated protein